jgi:glycosyltransferase involved in cell wall biosynthesis
MKILIFIESLRAGGKERRVVELAKGLHQLPGIELELVLTRKEIHYAEIEQLNIPISYAERRYVKKDPRVFFTFFRIVRRSRPDIIHVWGHMVAVYAMPVKWLLKIPLINSEITDSTPDQKLLFKSLVFKSSDRITANTQAGLLSYGAPVEKSTVIYNGFNFNRLRSMEAPDSVRQRFGIRTPFVIGMIASFNAYKDYLTYIRAALKIVAMRADVTFLCVGDGDDTAYRNKVPENLKDRILFLGRQSGVESIMNICHLGVLTTDIRSHGEGISNALMEFMALRKPVLATCFGGSPELVEDGVSGYLIDAFHEAQLADRVLELVNDEDKRNQFGQAAHLRIVEKFSIEQMVSRFYTEYLNLIREKTA